MARLLDNTARRLPAKAALIDVHIAISPVLIFGLGPLPALGPAGAGLGLVIPFAGSSAVIIWYLRSRAIVRLNFRGVTPRLELFADILKVGVPGLINIACDRTTRGSFSPLIAQFLHRAPPRSAEVDFARRPGTRIQHRFL